MEDSSISTLDSTTTLESNCSLESRRSSDSCKVFLSVNSYFYLIEVVVIHWIQRKIIITDEFMKLLDNNLEFIINSDNALQNEINIFKKYLIDIVIPTCEFTMNDKSFIFNLYESIKHLCFEKNFFSLFNKNIDNLYFNDGICNFINEHNRIMREYSDNFC